MARRVMIDIESDLSNKSPAETVEFAWNGHQYEIDLTDQEKEQFQAVLKDYLDNARVKVGRGRSAKIKPARTELGASPATVRAWARAQQIEVPARGRIPNDVYDRFEAANKDSDKSGDKKD